MTAVLAFLTVSLLAVSLTSATSVCPIPEESVYAMDEVPTTCFPSFTSCLDTFCSCNNLMYDRKIRACVVNVTNTAPVNCVNRAICTSEYILCTAESYADASENTALLSNCTEPRELELIGYYQQEVLDYDVSNTTKNPPLLVACDAFYCEFEKFLAGNRSEDCSAIFDLTHLFCTLEVAEDPTTRAPGANFPTRADGSFIGGTKIITITMVINQDFDALVAAEGGNDKIKDAVEQSFTKQLGYPFKTLSFTYTTTTGRVISSSRAARQHSSLAAKDLSLLSVAEVASADTATLNAILARLSTLKNTQSTAWLNALARACGCVIPTPTITSTVTDGGTGAPVQTQCGSGCVSGIVVGSVVAAGAVTGGAIAYANKASASTGVMEVKSHEPTSTGV